MSRSTELTREHIDHFSESGAYSQIVCTPALIDSASNHRDPSVLVRWDSSSSQPDSWIDFPAEVMRQNQDQLGTYAPELRIQAAARALASWGLLAHKLSLRLLDDGLLGSDLPGQFDLTAQHPSEKVELALPIILIVPANSLANTDSPPGPLFMPMSEVIGQAAMRGEPRLEQWAAAINGVYRCLHDPEGLPMREVIITDARNQLYEPIVFP